MPSVRPLVLGSDLAVQVDRGLVARARQQRLSRNQIA